MAALNRTTAVAGSTRHVPVYVVGPLSRTPTPLVGGVCERILQGPINVSADILYVIIENSPTALVLTWRRTCRAFFRAAAATLRLRYEKVVRPFVTSIPALDELLRRHGAIISGSVALQFFLYHETWEPADMDIYVSTHKFKDFIDDAISTDGLNFKPDGSLIPSGVSAQPRRWPIREIRRFVTQTNRRVDVVRSTTGTAVTPLNGFWSTLMQNFITPDGAACGYPDATLERRGVISQDHYQTDSIRSAIIKYEARGYTLVQDEWRVEFQPSYIRHQHYFGDRNAVVVDFRRAPYDPQPSLPIHPTRRSWFPTRPYPPRRFITYDHASARDTAENDNSHGQCSVSSQ